MNESSIPGDQFGGEVVRGAGLGEAMQAPRFVYEFECIGPDGEVEHLIRQIIDITERKAAEERLALAASVFTTLLKVLSV